MPVDFENGPSDRVKTWAAKNGHSALRVSKNFAKFILSARKQSYQYADWDAAVMTAIDDDWAKVGEAKQDKHNNFSQQDYHAGVNPDGTF